MILKTKNKFEGFILLDFKTYYKATAIKTVWYWQKDRQINKWNRIENLEVNLHMFGNMIFDQGAKTT